MAFGLSGMCSDIGVNLNREDLEMTNVKIKVEKKMLTITVDLSKDSGPSKSGKSTIIASTQGNESIGDGIIVGLNVYKKV